MPTTLSDIIYGCKQNSLKAQESLYKACYPQMIKVCLRYSSGDLPEAAELLNLGMLKVFQKLGQFRDEGEIMGWIRRVIVTTCIDQKRIIPMRPLDQITEVTEQSYSVSADAYSHLSAKEIMEKVNGLNGNTKLVFNLFVLDGYKHEEIAGMLRISIGTSKWHLNEARRLLKQSLEKTLKKETLANAI